MKPTDLAVLLSTGRRQTRRRRPVPTAHDPLPPFDQDDPPPDNNIVHTVLPPEQVIPDHFVDPLFLRGDFNGVTHDKNRWTKEPLPFLVGANSTPLEMLMSPMLPLYPRYWQDAHLTEHAERAYDDLVISPEPWNAAENGRTFSPADILAWCKYVKSWGFRTVIWRGDPRLEIDRMMGTLLDAGVVNFYIHGKEVDSVESSADYEASLRRVDSYIGGRIPIGVHFTANFDRQMGYPIGAPRDDYMRDWSLYDGRVHLMQQLDGSATAGRQGAAMYYARLHVNCGIGDAALGPGAPNSRVYAFETMATDQLYGRCTEAYGCLRSHELLCGTRDNPRARPVGGALNGLRKPSGLSY